MFFFLYKSVNIYLFYLIKKQTHKTPPYRPNKGGATPTTQKIWKLTFGFQILNMDLITVAGSEGSRYFWSSGRTVFIPSKLAVKFRNGLIFITLSESLSLILDFFLGFFSLTSCIASPFEVSSTVPVISTPSSEWFVSKPENVSSEVLSVFLFGTDNSGAWMVGRLVEDFCSSERGFLPIEERSCSGDLS